MSTKSSSVENNSLTASDFLSVWYDYDKEGKGFIEGEQLDAFLLDFIKKSGNTTANDAQVTQMKERLMSSADENKDGKLDICEVAKLLPLEENFLLLFRFNCPLNSSVEFMKIWKKYDTNGDGSLDSKELKEFLKDYHRQAKKAELDETKANEYSDVVIKLFDSNKDGMLQITEMAKLLPVEYNFLKKLNLQKDAKVKSKDVDIVFDLYDKVLRKTNNEVIFNSMYIYKNNNGYIGDTELDAFLKDLFEMRNKATHFDDLKILKETILQNVDDNKVTKNDFKIILQALLVEKKEPLSLFQRLKKRFSIKKSK